MSEIKTEKQGALCAERIRAHLGEDAPPIFVYDSVSSTGDLARERALLGKTPAVFIAEHQTAGRGRRGRSFASPKGAGIYMSLLFYPSQEAKNGVLFTTGAAVAMCRAVEDVTGLCPTVKWVNDLLLGGKKLCGILTEGSVAPESGAFSYAVIGIGINVHSVPMPPEVERIATALDKHTDRPIDRNFLAARMIFRLLESLTEDRGAQMAAYRALCPVVGKEVTVLRGAEKFSARVLAIENSGELRIQKDGEQMLLSSGEISIREIEEGKNDGKIPD